MMGGPGGGEDPEIARRRMQRINEQGLAHRIDPQAAVKHGMFTDGFMACRHCIIGEKCPAYREDQDCALERQYFKDRVQLIASCEGIDAELDMPLIIGAVWAEIAAARGRRWLAAVGEIRVDKLKEKILQFQPAASEVRVRQKEARDALDALNLTPKARRALGSGEVKQLRTLLGEAQVLEAAARTEPTDAEFTAEEADDAD